MKIIVFLIFTPFCFINAEEEVVSTDVSDSIYSFMNKISIGNYEGAIKEIIAHKIKWKEKEEITKMSNGLRILNEESVGKPISYELCKFRRYSQSYISITAMVTFERQPVFFIFNYYKIGENFGLNNFFVKTDVDDLIKSGAFQGFLIKGKTFTFNTQNNP